MRISTNWLKDYVEIDEDLKVLAEKVTKAGVNVEGIISNKINNLVVGHVLETHKHPNSDHLNICRVNIGDMETQIVCGASNVKAGIKVIVALPKAVLPGNFEIKASSIRGEESNGMICALYEIGVEEKTEESYARGIEQLPSDAPVGVDAMEYLGLNDTVYELDLNPNRNDCLSHLGFAYEVAAVTNKKVKLPEIKTNDIDESIKDNFNISVETDNCKFYQVRMVKDIVIKESPKFIKDRLVSAGMRSINNVVDISNYIMLEYGQPLHFFDKDKLGNQIIVRDAKEGEETVTLDGKQRKLTSKDIIITNDKEIVAIGGVMGCLNTVVDENTKNIVIESAIFNPYNVRYTSLNLDLRSESSIRIEKELNKEYTIYAIDRACYLLEKYASGKVLKDKLVHDEMTDNKKVVTVNLEDINSLLGMALTSEDVTKSLTKLDFVYEQNKDEFTVTIPPRRMDVSANKADIIEEIGRLYGYENITGVLPSGPTKEGVYVGNTKVRKLLSKQLRSLGLNETRTYTLISEEDDKLFTYAKEKTIKLARPLSSDKVVIRQSIIPSLLKVIDYNNARGIKDTMIYEIANTYNKEQTEITKIAIALKGKYITNKWQNISVEADFYLLKGMIENILNYVGLKNRYTFEKEEIDSMHPGISAVIKLDREPIGFLGSVHPSISKNKVYVAELSLNKIAEKSVKPLKYKEISKYPSITKDLAFVMKKDIEAGTILDVIKRSAGRSLIDIDVFDLYVGENVGSDEKSVAYTLTFQDQTKTLTDEEVNNAFNNVITQVETKTSTRLRK